MPESTMAGFRNDQFDEKKAYVPQEKEGAAFVSGNAYMSLLPIADQVLSLTTDVRSNFSITCMAIHRLRRFGVLLQESCEW